jgi:hypothetical protein
VGLPRESRISLAVMLTMAVGEFTAFFLAKYRARQIIAQVQD